jgi:predicted metal-dependent hydrolase
MTMSDGSLLDEGAALFNEARYFEAHEVWEALWRQLEGTRKFHCQGLIHAAVGLYHLQRGNNVGARNQLRKSLAKLQRHPESMPEIDSREFIAHVAQILDLLDSSAPAAAVKTSALSVRIRRL